MFSVFTNLLALAPTLYMLEVYGRVVNSRNTETLLMLTVLVVGALRRDGIPRLGARSD